MSCSLCLSQLGQICKLSQQVEHSINREYVNEDISSVISELIYHLYNCKLIFIYAVQANRSIVFVYRKETSSVES